MRPVETPASPGAMADAALAAELAAERLLLDRLRSGDDAAYDELVRATMGRLLSVARRMMGSEDAAHDAVQEAYLSAFRAIDRFDGRSRLATWLHRIAVNACLMRLRAGRSRPEQSLDALLPDYLEDGHHASEYREWAAPPDGSFEQVELRAMVRAKIDALPPAYRQVILLRDIEELDTEATAELLGTSTAVVKTRLHRARQALRTLIEPHATATTTSRPGRIAD